MIKLYREETSAAADAVEAEFRELVLAFERVVLEAGSKVAGRALPVITNNERVVSGAEIPAYLKELETLVRDWQLFQGDYCYVDEYGEC